MSTTDTPDLAPLLWQRRMDDAVADLLEKAFDKDNSITYEDESGKEFSLVVDETGSGFIKATLYTVTSDGGWIDVANVVLDATVQAVQS